MYTKAGTNVRQLKLFMKNYGPSIEWHGHMFPSVDSPSMEKLFLNGGKSFKSKKLVDR
jgi:hypothetical protein